MKALTVYQPWASLIMIGAKPHEFRGWDYRAREPGLAGQRIVIHAASRAIQRGEVEDLMARILAGDTSLVGDLALPLLDKIASAHGYRGVVKMSAGLGTATLGEPRTVADLFGGKGHDSARLSHHLWAWPLTDVATFPQPVPCRGMQGFWRWPFPHDAVHDRRIA